MVVAVKIIAYCHVYIMLSYIQEQDVKAMTESALLLMRQLPVARNAVLSYFGRRFDDAANRYLQNRVDKVTGNVYNSSTPVYSGK